MSDSHDHAPAAPHETAAHSDHGHAHEMHLKLYLGIGATLIVFTAITVWLSYIDFDKLIGGHGWNIIVALIVATFKVGLVAAIFMHLKGEKKTIWRFLYFTLFFVAGLFFLTWLHYIDPIFGTDTWKH